MEDTPIPTVKPSRQDHLLRDKLIEDIANQSDRMDALGRQLIALELAVPGLYATALKLVAGDAASITGRVWLYLTFAGWALALGLALLSLFPRSYAVDMGRLFDDARDPDRPLSVEGYFRRSALYKGRLLIASCVLFFAGVWCAVVTVL